MKTSKKMYDDLKTKHLNDLIERIEKDNGYTEFNPIVIPQLMADCQNIYKNVYNVYIAQTQPSEELLNELKNLGYKVGKRKDKFITKYKANYKKIERKEGFWIFKKTIIESKFDKYEFEEQEFEWVYISCCGEKNENNKE